MTLVDNLIASGYLKTPSIIEAFKKIKRIDFLPEAMKLLAELDEALPIGFGQTISQPSVVAFMLELLQPESGDKILDIGAGSGWTSALLAYIVSNEEPNEKSKVKNEKLTGRVIAIERIPELKKFGEKNISKYNFIKRGIVEFICGDGSKGCSKEAPFDKILVSAAIYSLKNEISKKVNPLKDQLKINGRLVIPIENSIWLFIKKSYDKIEEYEYPGFVFVPLVEK